MDKSGDCWEWTANKNAAGYGHFHYQGRSHPAHRMIFILDGVELSRHDVVAHHCDNPSCVNPDHLFLTDQAGNQADMVAKNRQHKRPGMLNPMAKLTDDDVRYIRQLLREKHSQRWIAEHIGIDQSVISDIKTGKLWKHIP